MEELTIKQYCEKYDVPRTTVQYWLKRGLLKKSRGKRPFLIPDNQPIPYKDDLFPSFRYRWKDEERGYSI